MRESKIEKDVCDFAVAAGWLVYKWTSPQNRGVPDRIFFRKGKTLVIEFKATGKKPTGLQQKNIDALNAEGIEALVVDNIEDGINVLT